MTRNSIVARLATVLAIVCASTVMFTDSLSAATIRAFGIRYQADTNGAIDIFGNTLLTCPTSDSTCAAAQNPANSNTTYYANNSYAMVQVDADGSSFSTFNSSSTTVSFPSTATVRFAGLYWGATSSASNRNQMKLRGPADSAYTTFTASQLDSNGSAYQGFANVTSFVAARGIGNYFGADVQALTGSNAYAGWSLVIAWEDSSQPLRNLTVFDGYGIVANSTGNTSIAIPLSGFLAPPFGAVQTEVGVIAYEGDRGVGATGDAFQLNSTSLSNPINPSNDVFNGTISNAGVNEATRNPNYINTLGYDADEFNASGILANSATSATVTLTTGGETFYPGVLTTAIDLYAPTFPTQTKTVTNLTRGTDPALPGDVLEYNLSIINTGLDPALNTVLTDVLPTNETFVAGSLEVLTGPNPGVKSGAVDTDQGEYISGSRSVRLRLGSGANGTVGGTMNPNASTTARFRVTVDFAASGTTLINQFQLDYRAQTLNRPFTFNSNPVSTPVADLADLQITKSATPNPIVAGDPVSYVVTVTNNGPRPAQNVVIADTLPSGVTLVTATPSSGSCTGTTCTIGTIPFPGSASVTYVVNADSTLSAGSLLNNSASVTSTTGDPTPGNENTTISTPVAASADVRVTKSVSPASPVAGSNVTWTIDVINDGPSTARAVVLTDALPAPATIVSATPSVGTCTPGSTVTCSLGDLADGATATITVVATVASSSTGTLANTAAASSTTPDPAAANNEGVSSATLTRQNNLSVTKTALTNPLIAGAPAQWSVTVTNNGPSDTAAATMTDPAPTGVTWTAASLATCTIAATVSCPLGSIPAGSSVAVVLTGTIAAGVAGGSSIGNTATVTSGAFTANGSSTTPVVAQVALVTSKTATPDPVVAGNPVTYTLTATNSGPSTATNVTISDPAPTGITFTGQTPSSGGSCTGSTSSQISCIFAALAPGATATVTVTANVAAGVVGTAITNVATFDTNQTAPQTATFVNSVGQSADVYVTKSAVSGSVVAGGTGTWQIVYGNTGPSNAQGVSVTDNFPAGMTIMAISGGSCSGIGTGTLSCSQATLTPSSPVTVTVTIAAATAMAAGPASNTVSAASTTPSDPTTSNNTASATMAVTRSADLAIDKSSSGALIPGQPFSWTVQVTNSGPSTADSVVVTDTLASGLTFDPATSSTQCSASGQLVTCTLPSLTPTATTLTIGVTTSSAISALVSNTATVSSATPDPTAGNNVDADNVNPTPQSDVTIDKQAPASLTAGSPATWTVVVTNNGPSDAVALTATDAPPAGVTWSSITSDLAGETCTLVTGVCTLPRLAAGGEWSLTYVGNVSASATGSIGNSATVASPTDITAGNSDTTSTPVVTEADLVVNKVPLTSPATAGTPVSWSITVTNQGPSIARTINLADTVGAGLTAQSLTPSTGTCVLATATCSLGDIAPGATVTVIVTTLVAPDRAGTNASNTVTTTSITTDPTPNSPTTATVPVVGDADLTVTKEAATASFVAGGSAQWTITVVNNGPSSAASARIVDTLPAGLSSVTATPSVGACTVSTSVDCAFGTMTAGQVIFVIVRGTLDATTADGSSITNAVTASSDTPDSVPGDNAANVVTPVITRADLRITKTAVSSQFVPGQTVSWTVTATNAGPSAARSVRIADVIPGGISGVSVSPTTGCTLPIGATLRCSRAALAPSASIVYTISGTLAPSFSAATLANTATVESDTADPDATSNQATATTSIAPTADVGIAKRVVGTPTAGGAITWELTVTNAGPSVATGVSATDVIPAGVSGIVASAPSGTTCSGAATITCTTASLPVGVPVVITLAGTLDSATSPSAIISNTATVSATTPDNDTSNNSSTSNTSIGTSADVSVTKVPVGSFVAGQSAQWTVTVTNVGPSTARAVMLADALPATLLSPTASASSGSCSIGGGSASCLLGDVAVGQVITITVSGTIDADATGSITNTVNVSSSSPDPDPADNGAAATSPVATSANLAITKSSAPTTFIAGQPATYTLVVTNAGPSVARNVTVSDPLAAGLVVESTSTTLGSCDTSVSCGLGDLPVGASATITLHARPSASYAHATNVANTASVSSATPDPTPGDDSDGTSNLVRRHADVQVTKTAAPVNPPLWDAGESGRYTLTLTNIGPSTSGALTLSDTLPPTVTFSSFVSTDAGLSCGQSAGLVTCTAADAPAGASLAVIIEVVLSNAASPGAVDNTVTVTQTGADDPNPDLSNNTATTSIPISTSADLAVSKVPAAPSATAGTTIAWTISVTNSGPSIARSVIVDDTLPAGLSWATVPSSCVIGSGASATSCSLGDIAVGDTVQLSVVADIDPGQVAGQIVNRAEATSSITPDPTDSNNTGSGAVEIVRDADIRVVKQASASSADAGTSVTWTLTATNSGPSTATDTVVSDTLPGGLSFVTAGSDPRCGAAGQLVSCELGTLDAGETVAVTVVTLIDEDASADAVMNTAHVSTTTPDSTPDNNSGEATIDVTRTAGLTIDKRPTGAFAAGGDGGWTIVVRNTGPSSARESVVTDDYPAGFTATSARSTGGPCDTDAASLRCSLGTLAAGDEVAISIDGDVDAGAIGALSNTARLASLDDLDGASDEAIAQIGVSADLSVTKSGPPSIVAGQSAMWTITVVNAGPATASAVVVDDPAPPGVTFNAATPTTGSCAVTAAGVNCAVGSLAPLASVTITVTGALAATASGSVSNTATASSATPDATPTNNVAGSLSQVARIADLTVTKTASASQLTVGQSVQWSIAVTNLGPSAAEQVVMVDDLVAELTPGVLPSGCSASGNTVRCTRASLAPGEVWTIALDTPTVGSGSVRNTVNVASSASDPSSASAAAATQVVSGSLPTTGSSPRKIVVVAVELVALGAALVILVRLSRRRRARLA